MGGGLYSDQEKRIAARFKRPLECSVLDHLELLNAACVAAGSERIIKDQLRIFHGVDLDAIERDLPRIEECVNELVIRSLLNLETDIARCDLFELRDAVLQDQFRVDFVDQLDFVQLARFIRKMRPLVDHHIKHEP